MTLYRHERPFRTPWHCPLALQRQEVLPCPALLQKGRDNFHSGFWINVVSPASVLPCILPVNPSVSPPTSVAAASQFYLYTHGNFGVGHWLHLQETHNEFELPLSMLSSLLLKIRLSLKVVFYLCKDQLQIGLQEGAKHLLLRHHSLNNCVNERAVRFACPWIFFLTSSWQYAVNDRNLNFFFMTLQLFTR